MQGSSWSTNIGRSCRYWILPASGRWKQMQKRAQSASPGQLGGPSGSRGNSEKNGSTMGDEMLASVCELAFDVAKEGGSPSTMKNYLYLAQRPPRAYSVAQRALEEDSSFRRRALPSVPPSSRSARRAISGCTGQTGGNSGSRRSMQASSRSSPDPAAPPSGPRCPNHRGDVIFRDCSQPGPACAHHAIDDSGTDHQFDRRRIVHPPRIGRSPRRRTAERSIVGDRARRGAGHPKGREPRDVDAARARFGPNWTRSSRPSPPSLRSATKPFAVLASSRLTSQRCPLS